MEKSQVFIYLLLNHFSYVKDLSLSWLNFSLWNLISETLEPGQ